MCDLLFPFWFLSTQIPFFSAVVRARTLFYFYKWQLRFSHDHLPSGAGALGTAVGIRGWNQVGSQVPKEGQCKRVACFFKGWGSWSQPVLFNYQSQLRRGSGDCYKGLRRVSWRRAARMKLAVVGHLGVDWWGMRRWASATALVRTRGLFGC